MNSQVLKSKIEKYNLMDLPGVPPTSNFAMSDFQPLTDEDEAGKRKFRVIGASSTPTKDGRMIDPETSLPNFAVDAGEGKGKPILINHEKYGSELPIGRTYYGEYLKELQQFIAKLYIDDLEAVPEAKRVIAGIDNGTVFEWSIGGMGEFRCSHDDTRMGWFGCEHGHYPLMKIMIDSKGNETDDPDKMVETEIIYAKFVDAHLSELSVAVIGAVPDTDITDAYSEVVEKASELYRQGVFTDETLATFSCFTDLSSAVNTKQQFNLGGITMETTELKPLSELETIDVKGLETQFAALNVAPEVQAIFTTLTGQITKQQEYLQTAYQAHAEKVADLGDKTTQQKLEAAVKQVTDMKTEVARLKERETIADAADTFAETLRVRLKAAKKREIGVSQEEKEGFYTQVDSMSDLNAMFLALTALESSNQSSSEFLENIAGGNISDSGEVHSDVVLERNLARTRASYR